VSASHARCFNPTDGVLTPDALSVVALTHVVLDVSYRDAKNRCLFDIPETRDELFKTVLGARLVIEGLKAGKIQVVLF
jgi:protein CMS1